MCARLQRRIIAYLNYRLRDKQPKVSEMCALAAGSVVLYVIPEYPPETIENALENCILPFLKETNVVSDAAAKCIGAMIRPEQLGQEANGPLALVEHTRRVYPYLTKFLPLMIAKFNSTVYATYSPVFYILKQIILLAKVNILLHVR